MDLSLFQEHLRKATVIEFCHIPFNVIRFANYAIVVKKKTHLVK